MAAIEREDVERVARLARLALTEEEKALFQEQLGAILEHVRALQRWITRASSRRPMRSSSPTCCGPTGRGRPCRGNRRWPTRRRRWTATSSCPASWRSSGEAGEPLDRAGGGQAAARRTPFTL